MCIFVVYKKLTWNLRAKSYGLQRNFRAKAKERPAHEKADDR